MIGAQLIKLVFIMAAALLILHAAFAAFLIAGCKKIFACFLAHAIMHFHCHPRRDGHVHDRYDGKKELFHVAKVKYKIYKV
jgi:hypothetical protein